MQKYSVAGAAKELGVSAGTIYALCRARRLRHERIGLGRGKILIPEDALEEYRRSVTVAAEQSAPPPKPKVSQGQFRHLRV
jgi:excisionase family DNA binding protein